MGTRLEVLARTVVPLDPWAVLGGLGAALLQELEDLGGKGRRLAVGEDTLELLLQVLWWWLAQNRHMPNTIQLQPIR